MPMNSVTLITRNSRPVCPSSEIPLPFATGGWNLLVVNVSRVSTSGEGVGLALQDFVENHCIPNFNKKCQGTVTIQSNLTARSIPWQASGCFNPFIQELGTHIVHMGWLTPSVAQSVFHLQLYVRI